MRYYDCIVIGGGHAGIEAALAASRMGCRTLMVTLKKDTIGQMSCNPAIGGVGKGQLVREIDALGGEMGLAADRTAVQFRQLNASKGHAVRSSRCQSDRARYRRYMRQVVCGQQNVTVLEDEAAQIVVRQGHVQALRTASGEEYRCQTLIVATGTFLQGRIHVGTTVISAGRIDEPAAQRLADSLKDCGFELMMFKTGTPPRLDGRTIDFSLMEAQQSDERPIPFSFRTHRLSAERKFLPCYLTRTTTQTYDIIRANLHLSPMYSGRIHATGVRYCPSIEDKIKKFPDKLTHTVFLEPEGFDTDLYYPNGISTGLPAEVQEAMVHSIPGLERAVLTRYGYSIEHAVVPPTELIPSLETKKIRGLFLAGQINGTTGYEEAAAQGLVAGINAALKVRGKKPFMLQRHEAYIGVLIDDLTTKGTQEPYRMFTSRVEHRFVIREDNADKRLAAYGHAFGLIGPQDYEQVMRKYALIDEEIRHLKSTRAYPGSSLDEKLRAIQSSPLRQPMLLSDILKRPEVTYDVIAPFDGNLKSCPPEIIGQVEYEIKYEGFIIKQAKDIERFRHIENIKIPADINYDAIAGLSLEIREKLKRFSPLSLGQAHRISGITPASISILMVYLKKLSEQRKRTQEKVES